MLKLFAKYTSIGVLNTLVVGRICFLCVWDAYASGAGELFPVLLSLYRSASMPMRASPLTPAPPRFLYI